MMRPKIAGTNARERLGFAGNSRVVFRHRPGVAQLDRLLPDHAHAMNARLIVAIALVTFPLTHAVSQGLQQAPQISVSGSAEVKVAPDEIYLRVGVVTRDENRDDARHQNDERVSKALGFLKNNEVKEKDHPR